MAHSPPSLGQKRFHVFLAHSRNDHEIARHIAGRLSSDGLQVWLDEWRLEPGDHIAKKVREELSSSDTLVVLISSAALSTVWLGTELAAGLGAELRQRSVFVVPVSVEPQDSLLADDRYPRSDRYEMYGARPLIGYSLLGTMEVQWRVAYGHDKQLPQLSKYLKNLQLLDFQSMDGQLFEKLSMELLVELGYKIGFHDTPMGHPAADLLAFYGNRAEAVSANRFLVEIKHRQKAHIGVAIISDLLKRADEEGCGAILITSAQLTSVAQEFLAGLPPESQARFAVVDEIELKHRLARMPSLVDRFFPDNA